MINEFIYFSQKNPKPSLSTVFTAVLFPLHLVFLASAERKMLK